MWAYFQPSLKSKIQLLFQVDVRSEDKIRKVGDTDQDELDEEDGDNCDSEGEEPEELGEVAERKRDIKSKLKQLQVCSTMFFFHCCNRDEK